MAFLNSWKESVEKQSGHFTANDREKMFLSHQTSEGLVITVNSVIEATQFLLESGMPFVLTEKFNQDVLEEYFGRQRALGRRSDNPSLHSFWYQSNAIRMQRSIVQVTGNTQGRHREKRHASWYAVDNQPLKKGFLALAHIDAELQNFTANIIIFSLFLSKNYFVRYTS